MSEEQIIYKAGSLIKFEEGAYSGYDVIGFFVALEDIDPNLLADEYLSVPRINVGVENRTHHSGSGFIGFLINKGLLMELTHHTAYLGAYRFERSGTDGITFS